MKTKLKFILIAFYILFISYSYGQGLTTLNIDFTNANTSQQEGNANANISGVSTLTVGGGVLATDETVYVYVGSGNNKSVLFDITGGAFQTAPALNYKDVLGETIIPVVIPANDYSTSQTIPLPTTLIQVVGDSRIEDNEELQLFLLKPSENFFYKMGEITAAATAHVINTPLTDFTVMTFDIHGLGQKRTWAVVKQQFTGGVYVRSPLMNTNPTSGYLRLNMTAQLVDGVYQFTIQFDPSINVGFFSNLVIRGMTATAGFSTPTLESSTHTILNDDKLTLSVVNADIAEGDADNDVPLQLMVSGGIYVTQSSANPMSVQVTITDGTGATGAKSTGAEQDYSINDGRVAGTAFSFVVPNGNYSTATSINLATVNIKGDTVYKGDKTFTLALSNPTPTAAVLLGTSSNATFTIKENEPIPPYKIKLEVVSATVDESEVGAAARYRVALYNGDVKATTSTLTTAVTVNYEIVATSTATSPEDYDAPATTSVILVAGSVDQVFSIPIKNDANVEVDETLIVRLTEPTTGSPIISTTATDIEKTVTIASEDFIPDLTSFTIGDPVGSLALGTDFDLSALVITPMPTNAVTGALTWTIPTVTAGYSIVGTMLRSDENTVAGLSVIVQASSGTGGSVITATKEIIFPAPTLASIAVARTNAGAGNAMVTAGGTLDLATIFTVTPTPANANIGTLVWTVASATGSTATATIADTTLTAGATAGNVTLTVTSGTGADAKTATIDITITAVVLVSFTIGDPVGTLALGTDFDLSTLVITPMPTNAVTGALTWTIPTVTAGYSIVGTMLRSDENTVAGLSVIVQASSGTGGSVITATKEITFPIPALETITVARTNAGAGNAMVTAGGTLDLSTTYTVTHSPSIADVGALVWTVASATGSTATATIADTTLTAGATAGDVTLTVTSGTGADAKTAAIDITITAVVLVSFTIGDPVGTLALGADFDLSTLVITPMPTNAVTGALTWTIPTVTAGYSIVGTMLRSDENTVAGLSVIVQASSGTGGSVITATKEIIFPAPTLASIAVARTDAGAGNAMVTAGGTLDLATIFTVTPTPANANIGALVWTVASATGSTATATIADTTLTAGATAGDVTLTVTSGTGADAKTATIDITISPLLPVLASIAVARTDAGTDNVMVAPSGTLDLATTFTVTPTPANANLGTLVWTVASATGSTATATIADTTLTAGATAGDVTLTVTSGTGADAKTAAIDITISPSLPVLASMAVARTDAGAGNAMVTAGGTLDLATIFTVTPTPANANLGTLVWTVASATGSTATATIADTILTAGATAGDVTLTVTSGTGADAKTATIDITITAVVLVSFTIGDPVGTLALGADFDLSALVITPMPTNAVTGALTWTIPTVTAGYSIVGTMLRSDENTVAGLSVIVQASSGTGGSVITVAKEIIFPAPTLASIAVARTDAGTDNVMVVPSGTLDLATTFAVTPIPANANIGTLVWTVASATGSTATATIADTTLTAGATAGDVTLTVASGTGVNAKTATIDITISPSLPVLASIAVARTDAGAGNVIVAPNGAIDLLASFVVTPTPVNANLGTLVWTVATAIGSTATATISGTILTAGPTAGDMILTVTSGTGAEAKTATIDITIMIPPIYIVKLTREGNGDIAENDANAKAVFKVALYDGDTPATTESPGLPTTDVTVTYALTGSAIEGTAPGTGDYANVARKQAVISAGTVEQLIEITLVDDMLIEDNETITLTLTGPSSTSLSRTKISTVPIEIQQIVTITSNERLTIVVENADIPEGNTDKDVSLQVKVKGGDLSNYLSSTTVDITINDGTDPSTGAKSTNTNKDYSITGGESGTAIPFTIPNQDYSTEVLLDAVSVNIKGDTTVGGDKTFTLTLSNPMPTIIAMLGTPSTATITIKEDDSAYTVKLEREGEGDIAENGENAKAVFKVVLYEGNLKVTNPTIMSSITVTYELSGAAKEGTSVSTGDYASIATKEVVIAVGAVEQMFEINIVNDMMIEDDETLIVKLTGLSGSTDILLSPISSDVEQIVNITSDDKLTVSVEDQRKLEGSEDALAAINLKVTGADLTGYDVMPFTVMFTITDGTDEIFGAKSTVDNPDYSIEGGRTSGEAFSVIIPNADYTNVANQSVKVADISIKANTRVTGDKIIDLLLSTSSPEQLIEVLPNPAKFLILDDDVALYVKLEKITTENISEAEEGAKAEFKVKLYKRSDNSEATVGDVTSDVVIGYDISGTAVAGQDYTEPTLKQVTIARNTVEQVFDIAILNDNVYEVNKTLTVKLQNNAVVGLSADTTEVEQTVTITSEDFPTYVIKLDNVSSKIEVNEGEKDAKVQFVVSLYNGDTKAKASDLGMPTTDITVTYEITASSTASANLDYKESTTKTVTLVAGSVDVALNIDVLNDFDVEENEILAIRLVNSTSSTTALSRVVSDVEKSVTIVSDDKIIVSVDDQNSTEGNADHAESVKIKVTGANTSNYNSPVTVKVTLTDGTAISTGDSKYYTIGGGRVSGVTFDLTIPRNDYTLASNQELEAARITIKGNTTKEDSKTFTVVVLDPLPTEISMLGTKSMATYTINDDDSELYVKLEKVTTSDVSESIEGAKAEFKIKLYKKIDNSAVATTDVTSDIVVDYRLAGTTVAGEDYTDPTSKQVTIASGSVEQVFDIAILNDTIIEGDETVEVRLVAVTGTDVGMSSVEEDLVKSITITSDEKLSVALEDQSMDETDAGTFTPMYVKVTGSDFTDYIGDLTIVVTVTDGTATSTGAEADYIFTNGQSGTSFSINIPKADYTKVANQKVIIDTVQINGDTTAEDDETILLSLGSLSPEFMKVAEILTNAATFTITNDDGQRVTGLPQEWLTEKKEQSTLPSQILSLSGENNELQISGLSDDNRVYIYNRAGTLVWETENYPQGKGIYNQENNYFKGVSNLYNGILSTGIYFMVIENQLLVEVKVSSHTIIIVE